MTLLEVIEAQRRSREAKRAEAHAMIDELFDQIEADALVRLEMLKRDVLGVPQH